MGLGFLFAPAELAEPQAGFESVVLGRKRFWAELGVQPISNRVQGLGFL